MHNFGISNLNKNQKEIFVNNNVLMKDQNNSPITTSSPGRFEMKTKLNDLKFVYVS
jgi:hypothetical protein